MNKDISLQLNSACVCVFIEVLRLPIDRCHVLSESGNRVRTLQKYYMHVQHILCVYTLCRLWSL